MFRDPRLRKNGSFAINYLPVVLVMSTTRRMSYRALAFLVCLASTASALPARATVDAYLPYYVPVRALQTDDICLEQRTMWAELGIPPASQMEALTAPAYVYRLGGGQVDVNELSRAGGLVATYVDDRFDGDVLSYEMVLDVSALSAGHGTSLAGRTATVTTAKLYLLALGASLAAVSPRGYRLSLRFVGLPSQHGVAGTTLNATTRWPYTATSPLLLAYASELLNVDGSCR